MKRAALRDNLETRRRAPGRALLDNQSTAMSVIAHSVRCAAPRMPGKEYDAAPAVPGATQGTAGKSITDSLRGCAAPVTVIDDAAPAARSPAEAFRGR